MNYYIFVQLMNLHAIVVLSQVNSILFLIVIGMDQKDIMHLYFPLTVDLIYKFKCNLQNTSEYQLH
jgi:bisphosphoglycerate-dependent phosphoglycerate mutase